MTAKSCALGVKKKPRKRLSEDCKRRTYDLGKHVDYASGSAMGRTWVALTKTLRFILKA